MSFNSSMSILDALDQSFVPETIDDVSQVEADSSPDIRQYFKGRRTAKGANSSNMLRETQRSKCRFLAAQ